MGNLPPIKVKAAAEDAPVELEYLLRIRWLRHLRFRGRRVPRLALHHLPSPTAASQSLTTSRLEKAARTDRSGAASPSRSTRPSGFASSTSPLRITPAWRKDTGCSCGDSVLKSAPDWTKLKLQTSSRHSSAGKEGDKELDDLLHGTVDPADTAREYRPRSLPGERHVTRLAGTNLASPSHHL